MPRGSAPPWRQKPKKEEEKVGASTSNSSVPPWRQPVKPKELKHSALSLKATNDPGGKGKMMYAPPAGTGLRNDPEKDSMFELDPQLKMAFQRNFLKDLMRGFEHEATQVAMSFCNLESVSEEFIKRVFSFDTLFKPLPRPIANTLAHNFNFLTRIFTQFFDPRGIQNVQRSIGLGQEQVERKVK